MKEQDTQGRATQPTHRGGRAWWQWLIGGGALLAAAVFALVRLFPGLMPPAMRGPVIELPSELAAAERLEVAAAASSLPPGNLLLITLDTTRADRLGCYGNEDIETPNIDKLASEGAIFRNAYSPVPVTLPSHSTMMTGKYPIHHGARVNALTALPHANETLAETLSSNGYQTAAFVSAFVLDPRFGIAQGFDKYDIEVEQRSEHWSEVPDRPADKTCDAALAWLKEPQRTDKPFFLWVHFFDPHWQYLPPAPYAERYKGMLYDGEIAFVDAQIGRLIDGLIQLGARADTLIVLAGDHGEGLGQHNEPTHGTFAYDSTLHVPLIFQGGPRLASRGVHIDSAVGLIDIAPTVLSLMGFATPAGMDGVDLTQPWDRDRMLFFETLEGMVEYGWEPYAGAQRGLTRYIHGPTDELYDLTKDPFEQRNLLPGEAQRADELKAELTAFYAGDMGSAFALDSAQQLTAEELSRLGALGYTFSGPTTTGEQGELLDAGKYMPLMRQVNQAFDPSAENWMEKGVEKVKEILEEHPDFYIAQKDLGVAYMTMGRLEESEKAFRAFLEFNPGFSVVKSYLAEVKAQQGYFAEAIEIYREVIEACPSDVRSIAALGALLTRRGESEEAIVLLERARAIMPNNSFVAMSLGVAHKMAGNPEAGIEVLKQALVKDPNNAPLRSRLAKMLRAERHHSEVVQVLRKGLELDPQNRAFEVNLAISLTEWRDPTWKRQREAVQILERVNEETDRSNAGYLHALARAYARLFRFAEAVEVSQAAQIMAASSGQTSLAGQIDMDLASFIIARDKVAAGADPAEVELQGPVNEEDGPEESGL